MDDAIRIEDIKVYIQRRQAYIAARRNAAETPTDKGKVIGMLQALVDFEGMIRQLRVTPVTAKIPPPVVQNIQWCYEGLANQLLLALNLPNASLDDFRDDSRQNRAIARHPEKRQGIILLGQVLRNKSLIDAVFDSLRTRAFQSPAMSSLTPVRTVAGNGGFCPFCGKNYKYAKALATHVTGCPQKPPS